MNLRIRLAAGMVAGWEHIRIGLNCQDAIAMVQTESYVCGVVSDGCGSVPDGYGYGYPRSEVGANLISRLVAKIVPSYLVQCPNMDSHEVNTALEAARLKILEMLGQYVASLSDNQKDAIAVEPQGMLWPASSPEGIMAMYLSATAVGFFVSDTLSVVFSIGDGFYAVNGNLYPLDTADATRNAPAYVIYGLSDNILGIPQEAMKFKASCIIPSDQVDRIAVATDGLRFLVGKDEVLVPGKQSKVGAVSQFWDDKVFLNADAIRRKLSLMNKDVTLPDWSSQTMVTHHAVVADDVAVIAMRRIP